MWMTASPEQTLRTCAFVSAISAAICSGEFLSLRSEFTSGGSFDWEVSRLRIAAYQRATGALFEIPLPAFDWAIGILLLQLSAAFAIIGAVLSQQSDLTIGALSAILFLTTLLLILRVGHGTDGADQMNVVITGSVALGLLGISPRSPLLATLFVAGQSVLAYVSSGLAKTAGARWRSGTAALGILSSRMYGRRIVLRILRPVAIRCSACWGIIGLQILAPLVLVVPLKLAITLLILLGIFHVLTATIMGLNTFMWSFIAPYPAIIFCNQYFDFQRHL